jgi:hypothetical protein
MAVNANGKLIYYGHGGEVYEIRGGVNGDINLEKL